MPELAMNQLQLSVIFVFLGVVIPTLWMRHQRRSFPPRDQWLDVDTVYLGVYIDANDRVIVAQALSQTDTRVVFHRRLEVHDGIIQLLPVDAPTSENEKPKVIGALLQQSPASSTLFLNLFETIANSPELSQFRRRRHLSPEMKWSICLSTELNSIEQSVRKAIGQLFWTAIIVSPPAAVINYLRLPFLPNPYRIVVVEADGSSTVLIPMRQDMTSDRFVMHKHRHLAPLNLQVCLEDPSIIDQVICVDYSLQLSELKISSSLPFEQASTTPPIKQLSVDCIARGAAVAAGYHQTPAHPYAPFAWYMHFPEQLSVKLANGSYHPLVDSWHRSKAVAVTTVRDAQTVMRIDVCVQLDSPLLDDDPSLLDTVVIEGLTSAPPGEVVVHVLMRPSRTERFLLEVQAIEPSSGIRVYKDIPLAYPYNEIIQRLQPSSENITDGVTLVPVQPAFEAVHGGACCDILM